MKKITCLCLFIFSLSTSVFALTCKEAMTTSWYGQISGYHWVNITFISPNKAGVSFKKEISGPGEFNVVGGCTENADGSVGLGFRTDDQTMHAALSGKIDEIKPDSLRLNFEFYYGGIGQGTGSGSGTFTKKRIFAH